MSIERIKAEETGKELARILTKDFPAAIVFCASRKNGGFCVVYSEDKGNNLLDPILKAQIADVLRKQPMLRQELAELVVDAYNNG